MFRQRLLTALVLVPLVLMSLFYGNMILLGVVVLFLVGVGGWEWCQLVPIHTFFGKLIFLLLLMLMVVFSWYCFSSWLMMGLGLWLRCYYPSSTVLWGHRLGVALLCLVFLPLFATSLAGIYQWGNGKPMILYILCLVWATDTGAYLGGKGLGRTKLIPKVSPGKTVEGALSGLLLALVVAFIGSFYFTPHSLVLWYAVATSTALISMVGDLFISMLKRRSQLKDTGHLFPGHGGVLDRIDSLISAMPLFYFCISFGSAL
ncbi:MAG: phosphatidate cytidylyltransferase [Legionellales bacterium]|nr:phosphatidate cytidylyltransferase [Legionellales bacterium]